MYTSPTNVPEESAESILSFAADTENIPCIGSLTSLIPSQVPFLPGKELVLCPILLLYPYILGYWLLNQIQYIYLLYQLSIGKYPYLGNTLVSLFGYVHGDIGPKYTLGIS
jgi:hypothetical protein